MLLCPAIPRRRSRISMPGGVLNILSSLPSHNLGKAPGKPLLGPSHEGSFASWGLP